LLRPYKYDAPKIIIRSRLEILATGCIQALPIASNLFNQVAGTTVFHFDLVVFVVAFLFVAAEAELVFVPECPVLLCVEGA
jgi:hypothetical protein